jgi:hypothetical protein
VPLVTVPTPLLMLPVPPVNTGARLTVSPAVIVGFTGPKLVIVGAAITFSVKDCVAFGVTPLLAVIVMGEDPVDVAVPEIVAVPLPLSWKVTVPGKLPTSVSTGTGAPVVVTENVPLAPAVNVTLLALVIVGANTWTAWIVKDCVAFGVTPLVALIVMEISRVVPPGSPLSVAVPFPLS